ncbi:MAG: hypothetical protein AAGK97_06480, partial [Bacteroidota bacterium]
MQSALDLLNYKVGEKIHGLTCQDIFLFEDLLVLKSEFRFHSFHAENFKEYPRPYTIEGEEVELVYLPRYTEIIVLKTRDKTYFRNYKNRAIPNQDAWSDYFIEPITQEFYRRDHIGRWYDIEGVLLNNSFFIHNDVLCSLHAKKSKRSFSFVDQTLFCNPGKQFVQLGKLVFDADLKPLIVNGQKVNRLGPTYIKLGKQYFQEVFVGAQEKVFINCESHDVFRIQGTTVIKHEVSIPLGQQTLEIFATHDNTYAHLSSNGNLLSINERPVEVDIQSHVVFNDLHLALNLDPQNYGYVDLEKSEMYKIDALSNEAIVSIDKKTIVIDKIAYRNIASKNQHFVYDEQNRSILKLDDGSLIPSKVQVSEFYPKRFGLAEIDGLQYLFYLKTKKVLRLSPCDTTIAKVHLKPKTKLLNAEDSSGNAVVIDIRNGIQNIQQAMSFNQIIMRVFDKPYALGDAI